MLEATTGNLEEIYTLSEHAEAVTKAIAHMELNLARDVNKQKDFCKYRSSKKKTRENVGPLLDGTGL